jgi:hypothetical protein
MPFRRELWLIGRREDNSAKYVPLAGAPVEQYVLVRDLMMKVIVVWSD